MASETRRGELILEIGFEGGSLKLFGIDGAAGWRFHYDRDESSLAAFLSEEDAVGLTLTSTSMESDRLEDALRRLDRWPWYAGYPLHVHPGFARQIMAAVRQRASSSQRAVHPRWGELCAGSSIP